MGGLNIHLHEKMGQILYVSCWKLLASPPYWESICGPVSQALANVISKILEAYKTSKASVWGSSDGRDCGDYVKICTHDLTLVQFISWEFCLIVAKY